MKTLNDSKHLMLGVGIVLGIGLVASLAMIKTGPYAVGRFQLGGNPHEALILDTVTGQVWREGDTNFSNIKMKEILY